MATNAAAVSDAGKGVGDQRRAVLAFLWVACVAAEAAALWPVVVGGQDISTPEVVFRVAGALFVATGLVAWQRRPENHTGRLMVATGFLVFFHPLASQVDLALFQTLAILGADFWTIPFALLLLVFPRGARRLGTVDRLILAGIAAPVLLQPLWMLFLTGPGVTNVFAVWPNADVANVIDRCQRSVLLVATVSLFLVLAWRWWRASPPLRRVLVPVLAGGAMMLSFGVLLTIDLVGGSRSQTWLLVTVSAFAAVPPAFLAGLLRSRLARVAVGDLLVGLGDSPSAAELRDALRATLRDPSLKLFYWLPEFGTFADVTGREAVLPEPGEERAVTRIEAGGRTIAALVHDPTLFEERELLDAAAAAARVALENAQLHVELQARLEELKGSRARIVEAGDKERQRLERNLHDGAQQRLIALSLELSSLEQQLAGDENAKARVEVLRAEIAASLDELREIARGLHPAVVSGHGLEVALEELAARSPVPVSLTVATDGRLPEQLEVAAFYVVSESLANVGKYAQASSARVDVLRQDGRLVVEIADDGVGGADTERGSGLRGLADRVQALDGRLRVWSPVGGGTRVRAELPYAP